ncbi:unnamed protein product [Peronospora belbahrii]|uniref:Succinate dehydrogenase assembly factor 4, mitochondrial n=1 Tax=Peronospora belbahrii TaxID=622444 RepID=A0AAU9KR94_9STRA|nr:unnamed protein product [Peronospora belbahrii]CAH0518603.1 unnamed protein product [Peronospora belbahrii]
MALRRMLSGSSTTFFQAMKRPQYTCCFYSSKTKEDVNIVTFSPIGKPRVVNAPVIATSDDFEDDEEDEDMVTIGPSGVEYGGPTRGGKLKEPTRFGDWERKGRCCDF